MVIISDVPDFPPNGLISCPEGLFANGSDFSKGSYFPHRKIKLFDIAESVRISMGAETSFILKGNGNLGAETLSARPLGGFISRLSP